MASATAVSGGRDSGIPAKHDEIVSTAICEACLPSASLPRPSATMSSSPRRVLVWRTVDWLSEGTFPRLHWLARLMAKGSAVDTLLIVNSSDVLLVASQYAKQPFGRLALSRLLLVRATGCTSCQRGFVQVSP